MGRQKDDWIDSQNEKFQRNRFQKIADDLGVTLEEIETLEPSIEDNTTNDDMVVGHIVIFEEDGDATIMAKIKHKLENGKYLYYGLYELDGENDLGYDDDDEDPEEENESGFLDMPADVAKNIIEEEKRKHE